MIEEVGTSKALRKYVNEEGGNASGARARSMRDCDMYWGDILGVGDTSCGLEDYIKLCSLTEVDIWMGRPRIVRALHLGYFQVCSNRSV